MFHSTACWRIPGGSDFGSASACRPRPALPSSTAQSRSARNSTAASSDSQCSTALLAGGFREALTLAARQPVVRDLPCLHRPPNQDRPEIQLLLRQIVNVPQHCLLEDSGRL